MHTEGIPSKVRSPTATARYAAVERRCAQLEAVVERQARDLTIQFKRIAQLQAELDQMRVAAEHVRDWIAAQKR